MRWGRMSTKCLLTAKIGHDSINLCFQPFLYLPLIAGLRYFIPFRFDIAFGMVMLNRQGSCIHTLNVL